jgi:hypothetical protein
LSFPRGWSLISKVSDLLQVGQAVWPLLPFAGLTYVLGYPAIAVASLVTATLVLGITLLIRAVRRHRSSQRDWNPHIWVIRRTSLVKVRSKLEASYTNTLRVRVLQNDVSRMNWRVGWTGAGSIVVNVKNPGFSWELKPTGIDPALLLIIHFDRPYRRGSEIDLEFTLTCTGTIKQQEPFYSVTLFETRVPKSVSIRIEFDNSFAVRRIHREIYASERAPWPMEPPEELELSGNRHVEWAVPVRRGRRYGVRWETQ